jgi:glycine/D-amino acid oxidase-like deaminating enzyme
LKTSANDVPESIDIQFRTPDGTYTSSSENSTLPCNDLIVTAGPWTSHVLKILGLPSLPIGNLPGHSIIVRPSAGTTISPTAVFSSIYGANQLKQNGKEKDRTTESPELFPRPDGTVYVAGENNAAPMPEDPAEVAGLMESEIADRLVRATRHVSFALAEGKVETRQVGEA